MPKIKPQLATIESQLYDLKVQAIKSMADDYVLEQAAKKENLSPEAYLKKHLAGKPVSSTDAKLSMISTLKYRSAIPSTMR